MSGTRVEGENGGRRTRNERGGDLLKGTRNVVLIQRPAIRSGPDPELRTENEV